MDVPTVLVNTVIYVLHNSSTKWHNNIAYIVFLNDLDIKLGSTPACHS